MKKIATYVLAATLTFFSHAEGYIVPEGGELVIGVEYLYLIPLTSSPTYVTTTPASGSTLPSRSLVNSFSGDSGIRVSALFDCCGTEESKHMFAGSWGYFNTSSSDSINSAGPGLQAVILPGQTGCVLPPLPFAGSADSDRDLTYNDADAVLRMPLCTDLASDIYFLGGLQFLSLDYRQKTNYFQSGAPANFIADQRSCNLGAGLKAGVDLAYCMPPIFVAGAISFHGKFSGALIIAQNKSSFRYEETATPCMFKLVNEEFTHLVPGIEAKIGFNYVLPFGNSTFAMEMGYNLLYYKNAMDDIVFPSSRASDTGRSFVDYKDLGLHGLYLGGGVAF